LQKCAALEKLGNTLKTAAQLEKCLPLETICAKLVKMRHSWKPAPQLKKFGTVAEMLTPWKFAPHAEK